MNAATFAARCQCSRAASNLRAYVSQQLVAATLWWHAEVYNQKLVVIFKTTVMTITDRGTLQQEVLSSTQFCFNVCSHVCCMLCIWCRRVLTFVVHSGSDCAVRREKTDVLRLHTNKPRRQPCCGVTSISPQNGPIIGILSRSDRKSS